MATEKQILVLIEKMQEYQKHFSSLPDEVAQWAASQTTEAISVCSQALIEHFKKIIESGTLVTFFSIRSLSLCLISSGQDLILKALDGRRLICESEEIFGSFISKNYISWGINKPGLATPETPVQVHEIIGDGTFLDIFQALPGTWDQKWLSQDQVIEFCERLPH